MLRPREGWGWTHCVCGGAGSFLLQVCPIERVCGGKECCLGRGAREEACLDVWVGGLGGWVGGWVGWEGLFSLLPDGWVGR